MGGGTDPLVKASVRFATFESGDLEAVMAIERAGFGAQWTRRQFLDEADAPFSRFVVARRAGAIVGYIVWWLVLDEVQIFNVAVHPDHQRAGIGKQLIELAITEGCGRGAEAATLEVDCDNRGAIEFYRALGFVDVGERRHYYGPGRSARLMEKRLARLP